MSRTVISIGILVFCLAVCGSPKLIQAEEQTSETSRTVVTWLECEECTKGELQAVVKLGAAALPSLVASLREGPSQASHELLRRHLITTYQELKKYETIHPEAKVAMSEAEYVKTYVDNYSALYQIRAATALAAIGGSEAKRALEEATQAPLRDDVKAAVKDSLEKLKNP